MNIFILIEEVLYRNYKEKRRIIKMKIVEITEEHILFNNGNEITYDHNID